ncbi:MAG: lipid II flippase MurJ, partial [Alphaproteobacteria bacterium]|nr:lipid II flippase MurJ [Alphaproteobacteria bacterium]
LASSVAATVNVGWLGAILRRRGQLRIDARARARLPRMLIAACAMAAALWVARFALYAPLDAGHGLRWIGLGLLIGTGLLAYAATGQALGAFDVRDFAAGLRRRRAAPLKTG